MSSTCAGRDGRSTPIMRLAPLARPAAAASGVMITDYPAVIIRS